MQKQEQREPVAGLENAADHGGGQLPWSGLSKRKARELANHASEPALPRIAGALKARIETDRCSPLDAGEPYAAVDHALLKASELKGSRLQAQVSGNFLISVGESIGKLVRLALLDPLKEWNQRSRRRRFRESSRLDDRTLKDIGLTRFDIAYGARYGTHRGYQGP